MGRKLALILVLLVGLMALSACSQQPEPTFQQAGTSNLSQPTNAPTDDPAAGLGYDPLAEEGGNLMADTETAAPTQVPTPNVVINVDYPYAGASPAPLDPIDAPSPTPKPELGWEYASYTATNIGVSFNMPVGWTVDASANQVVITEPADQQHDGYTAVITISKSTVTSTYTIAQLKTEVNKILKEIGSTNYASDKWSPSNTAERKLLDTNGVYANFSGTLVNGVRVRGRVHVVCVGNSLYTIICSQPAAFNTDYLKIYGQIQSTMKEIQ